MSEAATITHADFFAALFPDPDGLIELRALPSKTCDFFTPCDSEGIERFIRANTGQDLYVGVATRKSRGSGKLENCGLLTALFIDIDFKNAVHPNGIPEPEVRAELQRFPLKPSIIVHSGGGLYLYFMLREALNLEDPADRQQAYSLLRGLAKALGGDPICAQPACILRIPGTVNHKYTPARPVLIEVFNPNLSYNPSDLADLLPREPEATTNGNGQERRTQADWLALLQGVPKGQRYGVATQIAGHFLGIGRSVEEVEAVILGYLSQCKPPGDAEEREKARRMVRDFAAKDAATGNSTSDPLAPLRALADCPAATDIEAALRMVIHSLAGVDDLKRATLRQEALSTLKAKKVDRPAKLVDAAWALAGSSTDEGGAQSLTLADPEPWPESVDGAALLEEIEITLTRFVILPRGAATAIALWVLHAYCLAAFAVTPIMAVVSATMRCGKSTLLNLLSGLLPRALPVANITPAALFRCIEQFTPSLLIDEGDTFLTMSDELRGVLNAGHTRTAGVVRTVGEEFEPKIFKVFCPKVLAMIGKPPATIEDRSIVIPMKRKTSGEQAQRFRLKQLEALAPLCQKAARWALDHIEELRDADPDVPDSLNDRAADNWRPLLAIADRVGDDWPKRARKVAKELSGGERDPEADGAGAALIGDTVTIFKDRGVDRLATTDLIGELVKIEGSPWPEWNKGKPITPRALAKLLKPFGIRPKVERVDKETFRGYEAHAFDDACSRYFQDCNVSHPSQPNKNNDLDSKFNVSQTPDVTHTKSDLSIEKQSTVTHVTDRNPENGLSDLREEVCVL